jgi:hypothetical protein
MTSEEIKKAMQEFSPVRYKGIEYKRITAYIYRVVREPMRNSLKGIIQVELLDKNENSVTIAEPEKVELIE